MKNKYQNFDSSEEQIQEFTGSVKTETLQAYFKDAYMKERDRYNSMFGVLDNNPPFEYKVSQREEPQEIARVDISSTKKLKKVKRTKNVFIVLSLVLLGAVVFFAGSYFGLF